MPVPPRFLQRIRELCDQHGIVMIADEVQCGFARTGKLFALEHYGLAADIIVTGKSLGAGMPISAITGRADIMDATHAGGMGGTYGGNPLTCVAAIAAIEIMRQPAFLARVEQIGTMLRETLDGWKRASSAHRRRPRPGLDDADRAREGSRDEGTGARRNAGRS